MIVAVPVRNEAQRVGRLLEALAEQRDVDRSQFKVALLFDACTDGSETVAARAAHTLGLDLVSEKVAAGSTANAGLARRRAGALALRSASSAATAILTTDADSVPAPGWLAATLVALEHADVVAGRIVRDARGFAAQQRLETYLDRLFALRRMLDPVAWEARVTHHYTSGASLACSAETYVALDGFAPRPSAEDADFVDRAHAAGLRVRRDAAVVVTTSSRLRGRAIGGLAEHLARVKREGAAAIEVAHPADVAWRYRHHAHARAIFAGGDSVARAPLADRLGLPVAEVERVWRAASNAESFAMRIVPALPGGERIVGLGEAEVALDQLFPTIACAA